MFERHRSGGVGAGHELEVAGVSFVTGVLVQDVVVSCAVEGIVRDGPGLRKYEVLRYAYRRILKHVVYGIAHESPQTSLTAHG